MISFDTPIDRRRALVVGAGVAGGALAGRAGDAGARVRRPQGTARDRSQHERLPVKRIEQIIQVGGSRAAVAPDFSMTSREIMPVTRAMREQGWLDACLYNQETDEKPQLYFSHMLKTGDPYQLAREIRNGIDLTRSQ